MKIGVAIPTYKKDIIFLDRCLRSIENQTKLPDIVVISASSCKMEDVKIATYSFPFKIICEENQQNAGEQPVLRLITDQIRLPPVSAVFAKGKKLPVFLFVHTDFDPVLFRL